MYNRQVDFSPAYYWDQDSGKKGSSGCFSTVGHFRVYANPTYDYGYNPGWGYWVLGSTHRDHDECENYLGGDWWSGYSEYVEQDVASYAAVRWGASNVLQNYGDFKNYRCCFWEGSHHFWQQNGMATYVRVP